MSNMDKVQRAISSVNNVHVSPRVVKVEGAGKAYQSVAQSMAIAVQDATDYLRNIRSIAMSAIAVSTELMIKEKTSDPYHKFITSATDYVEDATDNFKKTGLDAGHILSKFPTGEEEKNRDSTDKNSVD